MKSQIPVKKGISKRICKNIESSIVVTTFNVYQSPKLNTGGGGGGGGGGDHSTPLMPMYMNSYLHAYTYQFDGMQWSKVETRFDSKDTAKGESGKDPEDDTDAKENGSFFKTEGEVHFVMAAGVSSRSLVKGT